MLQPEALDENQLRVASSDPAALQGHLREGMRILKSDSSVVFSSVLSID